MMSFFQAVLSVVTVIFRAVTVQRKLGAKYSNDYVTSFKKEKKNVLVQAT